MHVQLGAEFGDDRLRGPRSPCDPVTGPERSGCQERQDSGHVPHRWAEHDVLRDRAWAEYQSLVISQRDQADTDVPRYQRLLAGSGVHRAQPVFDLPDLRGTGFQLLEAHGQATQQISVTWA